MGHSASHEIAALRKAEREGDIFKSFDHKAFPKSATIVVSPNADEQYALGERLGLTVSGIQNTFSKVANGVRLGVSVEFDGSTRITHVNDIPLSRPVKLYNAPPQSE